MDAKSGVFTVLMAGAYMFTIHICTHNMKKGLLLIRCNGAGLLDLLRTGELRGYNI